MSVDSGGIGPSRERALQTLEELQRLLEPLPVSDDVRRARGYCRLALNNLKSMDYDSYVAHQVVKAIEHGRAVLGELPAPYAQELTAVHQFAGVVASLASMPEETRRLIEDDPE